MGKAAAQLAVSQPAHIQGDYGFGARAERASPRPHPSGVEPTIYGSALLKWSVTVFDDLRQGVDEIDFLADPTAGELRFGTSEVMMAALVPAVIDRVSREYPRMVFRVLQAASVAQQYGDLRARNVDFIFGRLATPVVDEDLNVEILSEDRLSIVAGIDSKWQRRRKINPAELINEPWALPPYDSFIGSIVKEAFLAKGLDLPRQTVTSNAVQLIIAMVATGRFLGVCCRYRSFD
jgi:DNA-binding transcriptional LysR family regulator